jgi:TM2 domain-containing membrane protein YozV
MVSYLLYALWLLSLLLLVGEIDRIERYGGRRRLTRFWAETGSPTVWFVPAVASLVLPGAGQLLNQQPLKALLAFGWPLIVNMLPRPWQFLALPTYVLLIPWYLVVAADALWVAIWRQRESRRPDAAAATAKSRQDQLTSYLSRRNRA